MQKYLGERDESYDMLMTKRRVLSHYLIFEKTQQASKSEQVELLEMLMLGGACELSRDLQINLQFKFSKNIDGFGLEDFLKVCVVMSRFESVTQEFWELC